jgi:hypothetical protein
MDVVLIFMFMIVIVLLGMIGYRSYYGKPVLGGIEQTFLDDDIVVSE